MKNYKKCQMALKINTESQR